ncbi:glycosyltransferase family 2 protein [Photobacterium lipolyticum]|uniref:Glycosyl transferase family 2 n=1 Tax=Photobacterium lipolyticum TaxID=266810 RepID=A0A2T3MVB1_9GAMM|nr:glycosyltransferase family 2 protein [Photobacterium lipolyticum]PSW03868.1 glycosyl transferase family 2 [Photobacterium lipolyticum]
MNALISIITPAYNCKDTIVKTYESILAQSYVNWEWVVTEDCSSDETLKVLQEIGSKDPRVLLLKNEVNSGAAVSRNNSIGNAKGEFLAFLDSDDIWLDNKLLEQITFMESNRVDFSFTAYRLIDESDSDMNITVDTKQKEPLTYHDMLKKKATLGCSTVMLRVSAFSDIRMPLIRTGQDYGLWLKLLKSGSKAYPISSVLTKYRILPNSISRNKLKKAIRQWEIYRHIENLSIFYSAVCFSFYAWRAVFRK